MELLGSHPSQCMILFGGGGETVGFVNITQSKIACEETLSEGFSTLGRTVFEGLS